MCSASVVVIVVFLGQWVAGWVCCPGFFFFFFFFFFLWVLTVNYEVMLVVAVAVSGV